MTIREATSPWLAASRVMLTNPGPATSACAIAGLSESWAASISPMNRGGVWAGLARVIATLVA